MNSAEYLRDLSNRIMHIPIMHGVNQADCDDLDKLAKQQVRPVLASFVQAMETKLKLNDHKGGWDKLPIDVLFMRASENLHTLSHTLQFGNHDEAIAHCADVANYVMMIFDKVTDATRRQGHYDFGGREEDEGNDEAVEAG